MVFRHFKYFSYNSPDARVSPKKGGKGILSKAFFGYLQVLNRKTNEVFRFSHVRKPLKAVSKHVFVNVKLVKT
jgi:hypothetical protein